MLKQTVSPYPVRIYIAGDIAQANVICRSYCYEVGMCVRVIETQYVYTGGEEAGLEVAFINYPRFPSEPDAIMDKALQLAERLIVGLYQTSACVESPDSTTWISRRTAREIKE